MEIAIVIAVNIATSFLKKYVEPKYGDVGVHLVLFMCSLVASLVYYFKDFPGVNDFLITAGGIFVFAISLYQVLLQYFPMFKGKTGGVK